MKWQEESTAPAARLPYPRGTNTCTRCEASFVGGADSKPVYLLARLEFLGYQKLRSYSQEVL